MGHSTAFVGGQPERWLTACGGNPDVSFTGNGAQRLAENPDVILKIARCLAVLDRV